MSMVFKSHQLQSDNSAYIELSQETLHRQLSILFPATGLVYLVITFSYFVSDISDLFTSLSVTGALLAYLLAFINKRRSNPTYLIWIFILFTSVNCVYGFYTDSANLVANTIALTIPLLCFFSLKHQHAWWYSLLFGMFYITLSAGEIVQKHLQINEALQNISAYSLVLVMAYLLAQHRNEAISRVKQTATTDFLTSLHNRQGIEAIYRHEAPRCRRYCKDLSLILIELDGLKDINDRYGLDVGDQLLMMLSRYLREKTRNSDHTARMGGEEFCLLLPETSLAEAEAFAINLKNKVADWQLELESGKRISVTISIGLTQVEYQDFSLDYLKADNALQRAINWGRDQIVIG
ncbi:GGDEF domain-containing protein [Photobacterium nomapromontoriensis]|uniref:GGDEF domain-containing protein n=1 Tax=Photobacterium nomapromontoriensis TaxID=2910237 RepID=UPI003D0D552D